MKANHILILVLQITWCLLTIYIYIYISIYIYLYLYLHLYKHTHTFLRPYVHVIIVVWHKIRSLLIFIISTRWSLMTTDYIPDFQSTYFTFLIVIWNVIIIPFIVKDSTDLHLGWALTPGEVVSVTSKPCDFAQSYNFSRSKTSEGKLILKKTKHSRSSMCGFKVCFFCLSAKSASSAQNSNKSEAFHLQDKI